MRIESVFIVELRIREVTCLYTVYALYCKLYAASIFTIYADI